MNKEIISAINVIDFTKDFIIDERTDSAYSYNDFFKACIGISRVLEVETEKDTVIVIMENSFRLAMMYFVTLFTHKRIAVIDPQKGKDEIMQIVCDMPEYPILCDDTFSGVFSERVISLPSIEFMYEGEEPVKKSLLKALEKQLNGEGYLITFTSGTSGVSKGVEHSFENLCLTAIALSKKVKQKSTEITFLHVMPMTYMAGILNSIIYPFLIGAKIVISSRFSIPTARSFWKTVIKYNCNLFWLSPSMLMMIDKLDRSENGTNYCHSQPTTFLIGTAPLTQETRNRFNNRYGVQVFASYGLSETLFISVETPKSIEDANKNCVGEVLDGVDYKIDDSGEMLIDVPWMFLKYTNENTEKYFTEDHLYKTGDLVKIEKNYLYITGRSKDLIIKGGINISPLRIEEIVERMPGVQEVAVLGVPDMKNEERILCTYTAKDDSTDIEYTDTQIRKGVLEKLGKNYTIDFTWCVNEIPRNINGKIDKNRIKELWCERMEHKYKD